PMDERGGERRVVRGAVADQVDAPDAAIRERHGDLTGRPARPGDRRPDRSRLLPDLRGDSVHQDASSPATMTSTPRSRSAAIVSGRAASFVTIVSTSSSPNTYAGATRSNFRVSARTTQVRAIRRSARSDTISGTESFISPPSGLIAPIPT